MIDKNTIKIRFEHLAQSENSHIIIVDNTKIFLPKSIIYDITISNKKGIDSTAVVETKTFFNILYGRQVEDRPINDDYINSVDLAAQTTPKLGKDEDLQKEEKRQEKKVKWIAKKKVELNMEVKEEPKEETKPEPIPVDMLAVKNLPVTPEIYEALVYLCHPEKHYKSATAKKVFDFLMAQR